MADETTGTGNPSMTPERQAMLSRGARKPPIFAKLGELISPAFVQAQVGKFNDKLAPVQAKADETLAMLAPNGKRRSRASILTGDEPTETYKPKIGA